MRHWSVYAVGVVLIVIALGAGIAVQWPSLLPMPLLLAIAGLGLVGVLAESLGEMAPGLLVLGPLFAFVAASSRLTLFGLGPLFWALVIGMGISLVLEGGALQASRLRAAAGAGQELGEPVADRG